jgi:hypothetical protein
MIAILLIALAAGAASALMFASIISGALVSLLLLYLAPLPLMVAAMGWGPLSASIGGIAAATGLGAIFGLPYCIAFAIMVALPAWWLGHLALLGRPMAPDVPSGNGASPVPADLEWYPVGRILLWISASVALTIMAALLTLGSDAATIIDAMRRGARRILDLTDPAPVAETEQWVTALVVMAPSAAAVLEMATLSLSLWLAAKITATSGRLHRPWPDLKSVELPPMTLAALCVAIGFCFAGGMLALLAQIVATTLIMAYALTGFAVLHTLTLALRSRAFLLGCTYAIVVMFVWPVLLMAVVGLADAAFGFRRRYLQHRPPPLPTS